MDPDADGVGQEAALAYAFRENILQAHLFEPLQPYFLRSILKDVPDDIADDHHLPPLAGEAVAERAAHILNPRESWEVGSDVLKLIHEAWRDYGHLELEGVERELCRVGMLRSAKLELPLIRGGQSNAAAVRRVKSVPPVLLEAAMLPLDQTDEEQDQGLEFPSSAYELAAQLEKDAGGEKIEINKETMIYLSAQLGSEWREDDARMMWDELLPQRQRKHDTRLTPPMSPKFQREEEEPFVPDSDGYQIPTPSDPASLLSDDLKAIEDTIFDKDVGICAEVSSETDGFSPKDFIDSSTLEAVGSLAKARSVKLEDYKIELPIVRNPTEEPPKVSVTFEEAFKLDQEDSSDDEEIFQQEVLDKLHETAGNLEQKIKQEQLEPRDGLARVPVPVLDFSPPKADWASVPGGPKVMFKYIRSCLSTEFAPPDWPQDKRAETEMVWVFAKSDIPASARESPIEDIESLGFLLAADNDHPTSASLVRKTKGLAILSDRSDVYDGDISPVFAEPSISNPTPNGLMGEIRKRKAAMEDEPDRAKSEKQRRRAGEHQMEDILLMTNRHPDGVKLLASFMEAKGKTFTKNTAQEQGCNATEGVNGDQRKGSRAMPDEAQARPKGQTEGSAIEPAAMRQEAVRTPAPVPRIDRPEFPMKLVISITLGRETVRALQALIPGVELIERDYDAYNSSVWPAGATGPSTVLSPVGAEADVIVSPSVGIILTTTVAARQRAQPGMKEHNALLWRVRRASRRYERLVVLVSDGSLDEGVVCDMSPADELAFAELQAFAAALGDEGGTGSSARATVEVFWVGGGQMWLARWAAALACRFARREEARVYRVLVQAETRWEVFLRRMGLNVFAAQAVCALLRSLPTAPTGSEGRGAVFEEYGLPAFVMMSAEERVHRFEGLLGGRTVLDRVNETMEQAWI